MALNQDHEIHDRRWGRNLGVALSLVGFAAILFGLTISKMMSGASMEAYDHVARPSLLPEAEASE